MPQPYVRFVFDRLVPMPEVEATLHLARIAVESLLGHDRVQLDAVFSIDPENRSCTIDTTSPVGRRLALIFGGYARREFGAESMQVERSNAGLIGEGVIYGAQCS